jgi:hypothetical protein
MRGICEVTGTPCTHAGGLPVPVGVVGAVVGPVVGVVVGPVVGVVVGLVVGLVVGFVVGFVVGDVVAVGPGPPTGFIGEPPESISELHAADATVSAPKATKTRFLIMAFDLSTNERSPYRSSRSYMYP